jgi:hypothetical protein
MIESNRPPVESRPPQKNFLIELWTENRGILKELLKHILIFALFIGSLTLFHEVLEFSSLPHNRKDALDKIHFYMSAVALVIFSTSFMIKVIIFEFKDMKK